jgi:polar amino acid transport system substrate-binding protein
VIGILVAVVMAATGCGKSGRLVNQIPDTLDTILPGTLKVAIQPYAPYTSLEGDKLVGLDSDILIEIANALKLKIDPQVTDFTGMLAAVQARRVDITIGGVAWSKDRQEKGLFTDPPYYSPPALAVRSDRIYRTVEDLQGLRLGTVDGYVWVKSIQAVPGAKPHIYPDGDAVFDSLDTGEIDVGILDPLLIIAAQRERTGSGIATQYLTPPTDQQVEQYQAYKWFRPYMTAFYLPKLAPKLEQAISAEIRRMYADGTMTRLIKKWGGDPQQFLKPAPDMAGMRRGVDRAGDWDPPMIRPNGQQHA